MSTSFISHFRRIEKKNALTKIKLTCSSLFWDRIDRLYRVSTARSFLNKSFPCFRRSSLHSTRECWVLKWWSDLAHHDKIKASSKDSHRAASKLCPISKHLRTFSWVVRHHHATEELCIHTRHFTDRSKSTHTTPVIDIEKTPPPDGGYIGRGFWQKLHAYRLL